MSQRDTQKPKTPFVSVGTALLDPEETAAQRKAEYKAMAKKTRKIDIKTTSVLEEIEKRLATPSFDIEKFCFPEQLKAVKDTSDFAVWLTSRRSGKTLGCN